MSRERRVGRSSGMGLDVESSGAGDGVPPVFWFLLGFRVSDGPVGSEYSTCVLIRSRGSCHICWTWLDAAEEGGEFSRGSGRFSNRHYGGGESRLGEGCAFRRDGFLPPQERRMGDGSVGRPRSTLRSASADLQQAQGERPLPGFRLGGRNDGVWGGVGD